MVLADIKALVTRPEGQAQGLITAIEASEAAAFHYPVMEISDLEGDQDGKQEVSYWQQCKQLIMSLDEFQHVIFISGNAVNFGMEWINQYWPQIPVGIFWYGIGQTTREKMLSQGLPVEIHDDDEAAENPSTSAMNSEELLQHKNLQQLAQQKVLIIRGVGGRDYLAQQLILRGATVSYAQCYQRSLVDKPVAHLATFIEQNNINCVLVNSSESLNNVCTLTGSDYHSILKKILLIVPSERVQLKAKAMGFKHIRQANNASDAAMLSALKSP
jgi:uroporphyrinogen-III synthase